ncbi:MAG: YjbQ family protein [Chloroflexi bacterium]|nr:YjbQ family protein [Chloroflexota bacterium]
MNALVSRILRETTRAPEFLDITQEITDIVHQSGARDGLVCVYTKHTTAAIKINENEPLLLRDMEAFLERVAPQDAYYGHNDFSLRTVNMTEDECPNGHSHCRHLFLGTSETIPLIGGELQFGTYQRVFLIELDRPRSREVLVSIVGA